MFDIPLPPPPPVPSQPTADEIQGGVSASTAAPPPSPNTDPTEIARRTMGDLLVERGIDAEDLEAEQLFQEVWNIIMTMADEKLEELLEELKAIQAETALLGDIIEELTQVLKALGSSTDKTIGDVLYELPDAGNRLNQLLRELYPEGGPFTGVGRINDGSFDRLPFSEAGATVMNLTDDTLELSDAQRNTIKTLYGDRGKEWLDAYDHAMESGFTTDGTVNRLPRSDWVFDAATPVGGPFGSTVSRTDREAAVALIRGINGYEEKNTAAFREWQEQGTPYPGGISTRTPRFEADGQMKEFENRVSEKATDSQLVSIDLTQAQNTANMASQMLSSANEKYHQVMRGAL